MDRDEHYAPEREAAGSRIGLALIAFLIGVGFAAAALYFSAATLWPRPVTLPQQPEAPAPQPSAAPLPAAVPVDVDLAALATREQALATQLDSIEARMATVDSESRAASNYATRAEALLIAFATRRLLDRGEPLGQLEYQLRQRFGARQPQAVATIIEAGSPPVTLEDLRLALDTIAPRLVAGNANDSVWTRGRRILSDLIVLRQNGSPSARPADRLKRIRRALAEGKVEAALAEVVHMPGSDAAQNWITAAKRYIGARRALDQIEAAAMAIPIPPGSAPAQPPEPARAPANKE